MRIGMCSWRDVSHPRAGGAENYTHDLLSAIAALGHDVHLFTSANGRHATQTGYPYTIHRFGRQSTVYRQARRAIEGGKFGRWDLAIDQVNTVPFSLSPGQYVQKVGALIFQTCEDIWPYLAPFPLAQVGRRLLEPRWMSRFADTPTVTLTDSCASDLRRFGLESVTVVPVGQGAQPISKPPKFNQVSCVHVGRLVPYKRVNHVIYASRRLPFIFGSFRLHIIGDGPDLRGLQRDSPPYVEFHGHLSAADRDYLVARSHLNVATSVREGWGLGVTEAASLGTPTLAYDVSGLRDSVKMAGGWLCPPSVEALSRWLPRVFAQLKETTSFSSQVPLALPTWHEVAHQSLDAWLGSSSSASLQNFKR